MQKITITIKIIIILIIQYLPLKFIPFRFYIWKITKTKSLNPMSKKGYLDCEYAFKLQIISIKEPKDYLIGLPMIFY